MSVLKIDFSTDYHVSYPRCYIAPSFRKDGIKKQAQRIKLYILRSWA